MADRRGGDDWRLREGIRKARQQGGMDGARVASAFVGSFAPVLVLSLLSLVGGAAYLLWFLAVLYFIGALAVCAAVVGSKTEGTPPDEVTRSSVANGFGVAIMALVGWFVLFGIFLFGSATGMAVVGAGLLALTAGLMAVSRNTRGMDQARAVGLVAGLAAGAVALAATCFIHLRNWDGIRL